MASQGPLSPATASQDGSSGSGWDVPNNVFSSNNSRALHADSAVTSRLTATNFGFSVPTGATIAGVVAEVECSLYNAGLSTNDNEVLLVVGGTPTGSNKASATTWTYADTYISHGGAADVWGCTLTPAIVNASDFGVAIKVNVADSGKGVHSVDIDHIRITVYYTAGGGGGKPAQYYQMMRNG